MNILKVFNITKYKKKHFEIFFYVLLGLFITQALIFALNAGPDVYPDESRHFALIKIHKDFLGLPVENAKNLWIGNFSVKPYFYHLIFGNLLYLNVFDINPLYFLRIINILMIGVNIYLLWKLFTKTSKNYCVPFLALAFLTNSVQYVFISSAINSDSFVMIFSTLSVWLIYKIKMQNKDVLKKFVNILLLGVIILAGYLTKRTYMPIGFAAFILFLILERKFIFKWENYKNLWKKISKNFKNAGLIIGLLGLMIVGMYFNYKLHGRNLIKYGSFEPKCHQHHEVNECMSYAIFARDYPWEVEEPEADRMNIVNYFINWMRTMVSEFYFTTGHKNFIPPISLLIFPIGVLGLGVIMFIRYYRGDKWFENTILAIGVFHVLILSLVQNYRTYLRTNDPHLSVQGRYWFGILPFVYFIVAKYILKPKNPWLKSFIFWASWIIFLVDNIFVTYNFYQIHLR